MSATRWICILSLLLLWAGATPVAAQESGREGPGVQRSQRWKEMKSQRKQDMRRRFDRLHGMDADKRRAKLDRAKHLREIMAEVYRKMDGPTKKRVDALTPEKRSQLLGHLALEEARSRSREARLILGSEKRQGPDARHLSRQQSKEMHEAFLRNARKKLGDYIKKNGLPKGISQDDWNRFRKLKGRKFGHELRRLSEKYPELIKVIGRPPGRPVIDQERWELHQAMRLPPREHMGLMGSGGKKAHKKEMASRRKRVMAVLKSQKGMTPESLKKLEASSDREFMKWMRSRLGPEKGAKGERRHGPDGPPRMGPERGPGVGPPPGHRPPHEGAGRPPHRGRPPGDRISPHPDKRRKPRPPRKD